MSKLPSCARLFNYSGCAWLISSGLTCTIPSSNMSQISVDGVFARLDELQLQRVIRLSELPLAGKIRAVYQTIGSKTKAPRAVGYKRGRLQEDGGLTSRQKNNL